MNNEVLAGKDSLYASACIDKATNELIIKIANTIGAEQAVSFNLEGLNTTNSKGIQTVIRSDDMNGVNSFEQPMAIVPVMKVVDVTNKTLSTNLSPNSFTVIRLKL